jgi:A/G-specific adenine glycosylase
MRLSLDKIRNFQKTIYQFYRNHGRKFPWRETKNPYRIWISEIMLQQTQTDRVVPKYQAFVKSFPTIESLAKASLHEVLLQWQGLGYNRRAVALKRSAEKLVANYGGKLPKDTATLLQLPGIGPYTAAALQAFVYNQPSVFIETNIRTVFIYFFFPKSREVTDTALMPLIASTLDDVSPRDWYYALMDYGAMLKKTIGNVNKKSAHYSKQSAFKGSNREMRGKILKAFIAKQHLTQQQLLNAIGVDTDKIEFNLYKLVQEGFIFKSGYHYRLA